MPVYVAGQSIKLRAGQNVAVLDAEDLADGDATEAVFLDAAYGSPVPLTIINNNAASMTLEVAAVNEDADFNAWNNPESDSAGVTVTGGNALYVQVAGGLFYRLLGMGDTTAGTVWMAR